MAQVEVAVEDLAGARDNRLFSRRTLGLDVGGTNLKAIVIEGDDARRTLHRETLPTPRRDGRVDTAALVTYGINLKEEWGAERMGVAVAGVSNGRGIVHRAVNLGWNNEPVGPSFERDLQIPVKVINDGQAAALAEGMLQRATVVSDIFVVVIGTGIAGAHLVDGIVR